MSSATRTTSCSTSIPTCSTTGELRSFLNRAFTCELNEGDGQWYIKDHRLEVLGSEWFQRRL